MTFYVSAQSSLSIFAQKHLCKWEDAYFILKVKIFALTKIVLERRNLEMNAHLMCISVRNTVLILLLSPFKHGKGCDQKQPKMRWSDHINHFAHFFSNTALD